MSVEKVTLTVSVDASELIKRIDEILASTFDDEDMLRAVAAWFSPIHPDQGDYVARMRKAISAALVKEAA